MVGMCTWILNSPGHRSLPHRSPDRLQVWPGGPDQFPRLPPASLRPQEQLCPVLANAQDLMGRGREVGHVSHVEGVMDIVF
jgi:hypothetical protein